MITPEDIRSKAQRQYAAAVDAFLAGNDLFFPRRIPANLKLNTDYRQAMLEHQALRDGSKGQVGYGYTLRFEERRSRSYGTQQFVTAIEFETREDLLRLIGKLGEFQRLVKSIEEIRARQPRLEEWLRLHWKRLVGLERAVPALLDVVQYLERHPRPNCFVRELPLNISTKLVEEHQSLVAAWLDELLPASAIDVSFDRQRFAERYGFRSVDDQFWFRILDPDLLTELQCPGTELAMPRGTLSRLPVRDAEVILVENKTNLLTLPMRRRTVALGVLGRAVSLLFRVDWINSLPIKYFGDLDVEGLQMLAATRNHWPQTQSLFMDMQTLEEFSHLVVPGNAHPSDLAAPETLTAEERIAFEACRDRNWRLEQERIPQAIINTRLAVA